MTQRPEVKTNVLDQTERTVGYFFADPTVGNTRPSALDEEAFQQFCAVTRASGKGLFATKVDDPNGYQSLLDYIESSKEPVAVVVPSLDVFGPRPEDAAIRGLEIEYLGGRIQLINQEPVDSTLLALKAWTSPPGAADIRERIKTAMRNRAIRGEGLGKPPYGYRIGKNRKLEIHEVEAETVKLIYTLYTQKNMGIRLIVRHLNEEQIPTRKGANWSLVTVRDILRNRAYLGTYTRFGMRVPGSHASIVTPDMFRWAQSKMDERKPKRGKSHSEPFLLSGLIYCGFCGQDDKRMIGVTRRQSWTRRKDGSKAEKQYRYYQCQTRTNQSMCEYHTLRAHEVEDDVLAELKSQRSRVSTLKGRRPALSVQALRKEKLDLEAQLKAGERRLKQAAQSASSGKTTVQRFKEQAQELIGVRLDTQSKIRENELGKPAVTQGPTAGQQAAKAIDDLTNIWMEGETKAKRALLEQVVDRVVMFDDGSDVQLKVGS